MHKKTIIFGAPKTFGITEEIIKNLEFMGFEVIDITFDQQYKYENIFQRLNNLYQKVIHNNRSLKTLYRFNLHKEQIYDKINRYKHIDYTLIIRPDNYPLDFLNKLKSISGKMVGYQWDGLDIFPDIKKYFSLFDRFFVFDENDVSDQFLPTTNFYFDYNKETEYNGSNKNVYFLGSFVKNRIKNIKRIITEINKTDFEADIFLLNKKRKYDLLLQNTGAKLLTQPVSFQQNLQNVKNASVLIDFQNNKHGGLSFRIFEALFFEKKILTNNPSVKRYDFYNENNIYIFHEDNINEIAKFLNKPYQKINSELINKYSFTNWIKYILDIDVYTPITLPKRNINNNIIK
ncbi:hypothetical protein CMT89_11120 [Elizabethkingia anophelis]|uniref:hypothetical protein n=1 Tax=Elizabethkingia anophelis TaxID=1117645 RepID=UPI000CE9796D|nr:hypothetical protein [Elizabethkingia anophelis]AVF47146.1 hypothetical protein AL491_03255 [Elizabethkingia anophelis]AVF51137.1 hypothetical protein AL492_05660 [Elizabethkingia anophelis]MBG0504652.1 hypothetical protein [Elizabethkingia anophelis]MCT4074173.1 hypothetical protein [Elizabethkingia anophelis]MDV3901736.1 hypothetical protein [Elizabethkingia anophelis]